MASNPNPQLITNELWAVWEQTAAVTPGVRLGGIYANKSCYHNTVRANKQNWPSAYCIRLPLDLEGPFDKARAIDWTMSETEMIKRTGYLKRAADHPFDNRLKSMREFIGTINGTKVICYIRDTDSGPWNLVTGRDTSHLWHVHVSFWTKYVNDWKVLRPFVSVWSGQTWEAWLEQEGEEDMNAAELLNFIKTTQIAWPSNAMRERMIARNLPASGLTISQLLTYTYEMTNYPDLSGVNKKLDEILAAALDDGNVDVQLPPTYVAMMKDIQNTVNTLPDTAELRDAVADLGEGGSAKVRGG